MIGQSQILHGEREACVRTRLTSVPSRKVSGALTVNSCRHDSAFAAIAAAAQGLRRKQAETAVGITERPMDEHFGFHTRSRRHIADFFKGQFTRQDDARETETAQSGSPGPVVHRQLRAGVQFEFGEMAAGQPVNSQVLNDQGVDFHFVERGQRFDQLRQFILTQERIDRHKNEPRRRQTVSVGDYLGGFVQRDVFRFRPGRKFLETKVDGVGAIVKGSVGRIWSAGRRQQFDTAIGGVRIERRHGQGLEGAAGIVPLRSNRFRRVQVSDEKSFPLAWRWSGGSRQGQF